ncbi:leucine-rich repeat protein [Prevotella sp. E13-17]|uniref:leucine-rich repeat protein n=1 Tax=Prevotella sp. E13-17 TaxID=2913616 RepID=UPI001EDA10A9|nr:leucine-rich repeat protein [Prevotella sp. E13-17]UKK51363.1 leucine-rich repeat protein [Prevotella sp. E13-17]
MKRLLFSFLFVLTAIAGWAQEQEPTMFTVGNFKYTVTDEANHKVSIAKADEATLTGALEIPSSVTHEAVTYAVTSVGAGGFYETGITSVTIPASVTSVGDAAFQACGSITSITIEDSEAPLSLAGTYGERPFWNNASIIYLGRNLTLTGDYVDFPLLYEATSVELGPKVTTINPYLFSENSKLENLTIGSGVTTIGEYAFNRCGTYWDDETHQGVENLVVTMGSNVTTIGAYAFEECSKLKSVTLPSTLTTIGNEAFYLTGLTSISIPASVTSIGDLAFQSCDNMTSITIEDSETPLSLAGTYSERPLWNPATTIYIGRNLTLTGDDVNYPLLSEATSVELGPKVTTINPYLFSENSKLENLTIGSGVTTIGEYAFYGCGTYWDDETHQGVENLVVTMGSNVTSIGANAFKNCGKLKSVTLPSTLTTIGSAAFHYTGLTSISIPASVTSIGDFAFQYCDNMTSITIEDSETPLSLAGTYSERPLWNPATTIYIGRNLTLTGEDVNYPLLENATSVEFGPQVTVIPNYLFSGVTLSSVKVPWLTPVTLNATTFSEYTYTNATLWVPGGTKEAYEAATNWKEFANMDFSSFVVRITGSDHGTLAVADISSTNGEEETTLIDRGEDAVFTVTLATGYEASTFTVNGEAAALTDNSYTVEDLSADQTVVAGFTAINYTIGYDLAGGSVASANPATYTIESTAITLNNPTREGYTFTGWTGTGLDAATTTVTIAAGSTGNRSYTATWTPITYNIVYTMDGGTATPDNPTTYTIETETFTLNNPTKTGYDFAGWKLNGVGEAMMTVTIAQGSTGHLAYTATWTPIVYEIAYTLDGGTATNPATYTIETETFTLNNPTKAGYDFAGWKLNGVGEAMMTVTITQGSTGHLAYTATWTPTVYNIVYMMDGGTATPANPTTYTIETETFTLNNPTKTGYTFKGWKQNGEGGAMMTVTISQGSTGHLAYTATWQVNQYTITFDSNGGSAVDVITQDYGSTVIPPAEPTKTGYDFAGWTPALPATMPAENITVTANWTVKTYTVSITGTGVSADNMNPKYGDDVVITIAADEDRTLNTLTVNNVDVTAQVVNNQYTIQNVTGNVVVVATFNATKEFITLAQGVGTFSCAQDLNFTGSGLKAYIAAGYSYNKEESQVLLVRVYDIPAGTGLYLKGEAGVTYKIPYSTSQAYYVNMLKANLTASSIAKTSGDMSNFLLNKVDGEYKFCAPSATATLGAQKAYLQVPTSFMSGLEEARAISIAFEDDGTTNISDFELFTNSNEHLYNLKGQRVEKAGRGLYIKNGKKVVIK